MATEAQINANRQNAENSTGPRTDEGKAAVSKNAVKHGLFVTPMVITGEDQERFDLMHEAMLGNMLPVGPMETFMAERIIGLSWRLDRAVRMQNQVIEEMIEALEPTPIDHYIRETTAPFLRGSDERFNVPEPAFALGRIARHDWANDCVLERLLIYERRMESSMHRTMIKLKQIQVVRRIEKDPAIEQMPPEEAVVKHPGAYLKKQTQFASAMEGAKAYRGMSYDEIARSCTSENKAKQSQSPDFGREDETRKPKSETMRMPAQ